MSILFAGTPENAAITLRELVQAGVPITLVLTRPDAPVGRKSLLTPSPVAKVAEELGLACIKTATVGTEVVDEIKAAHIDFAVVVAFGVLLSTDALKALPKGWFNLHYSLLPRWRGAAPVQWSIASRDHETGVTLFQIDRGLDTGPVLASTQTQIQTGENSGDLLSRLTHLGVSLLLEQLPKIASGIYTLSSQSTQGVTLAPKLTRRDGRLRFGESAKIVEAQARSVTPEPGAWFDSNIGQIKVLSFRAVGLQVPEGLLQIIDGAVLIGTGSGSLELLEVQPAGKKPMSASDWYRGLRDNRVEVLNG